MKLFQKSLATTNNLATLLYIVLITSLYLALRTDYVTCQHNHETWGHRIFGQTAPSNCSMWLTEDSQFFSWGEDDKPQFTLFTEVDNFWQCTKNSTHHHPPSILGHSTCLKLAITIAISPQSSDPSITFFWQFFRPHNMSAKNFTSIFLPYPLLLRLLLCFPSDRAISAT